MMPAISIANLISWATQVLSIALIGALLPLVFRIRHPRSHLAYCYVLLAACLVLPFIQPWQHPLLLHTEGSRSDLSTVTVIAQGVSPAEISTPWRRIVIWLLFLGIAAKVIGFVAGLWQIRRYRKSASVLCPVPEAVQAARTLAQQDALVCISHDVGPVTFGLRRPIVLLPESFLMLSPDSQRAVACHELLHVKRRDWLTTVIEELVGAVLWFHPAVWWLLSQTKLAREQVVDAEVIRLTEAPEPYIRALLAMAGADPEHGLVTAPAFLRKRHLTLRLRSLLMEVPMSRLRLLFSYGSMACLLAAAGWLTLVAFPLTGQPQIQEATPADGAGVSVEPGGSILHRNPVFYPWEARQRHIEGAVIVGLALNAKGEVIDAHVLSGPDELRKDVLQSVLQWHYVADVTPPGNVQARIEFRVPAAASEVQRTPPANDAGTLESIDVSSLPESLRDDIWQRVQAFKGQPFSDGLMSQVENAVNGADSHLRLRWAITQDKNHTLKFAVDFSAGAEQSPGNGAGTGNGAGSNSGSVPESGNTASNLRINVDRQSDPQYSELARKARAQRSGQAFTISEEEKAAFNKLTTDEERQYFIEQFWLRRDQSAGGPGPSTVKTNLSPGSLGFSMTLPVPRPGTATLPAGSGASFQGVLKVGGGVSAPTIIRKVDPQYSEEARAARYQGTVVLQAIVREDGTVQVVQVTRSLGFGLDEQAVEALQQWLFNPARQNGVPVAVMLNIEVNFNLR